MGRTDESMRSRRVAKWLGLGTWSAMTLSQLAGCGASDSEETATDALADGIVSGLDSAEQALSGASPRHRFSIGKLLLGSCLDEDTPERLNTLILLHSLDADGDRNNGIQITGKIRRLVSEHAASIKLDQLEESFRPSLDTLMTDLNAAGAFTDTDPRPRMVSTASAAREYFEHAWGRRKVVATTGGWLSGFEANETTWQFLGIPYAKPPLGSLRWRPPEPPKPWTGLRHAIAWSDQAAQNPANQALGEGGMSEDSLYLNVTAPKHASGLPVMVWFHGGAFTILTGNSKQYNNPASLTTKGVVLVTVNHRLGPFGYLAHPLLTQESGHGGSGNYGQMDLVKALTWVRDNIAAFGGDPSNVTIFGQSGGGGKTYALMNSPAAKGLFHRAIVQSGANAIETTSTPASSLASAEAIGSALFERIGATSLEQARALPWTAIVQADIDAKIPRETYRPNVDFQFMPKTYSQNVVDGMPSDVPLMVGATSGDYASLRAALPTFMAQRTPSYESSQYVYKFSRVPDGWASLGLLSGHGGEIPYLFRYPAGMVSNYTLNLVLTPAGTKPPIGDLDRDGTSGTDGDADDIQASMAWGPDDDAMVERVETLWTNFAKTGNPSTPELTWPPYDLTGETYVELGSTGADVKTGLKSAFP